MINFIKTDESIIGKIQEIYLIHFKNYKIRFTQTQVQDIYEKKKLLLKPVENLITFLANIKIKFSKLPLLLKNNKKCNSIMFHKY